MRGQVDDQRVEKAVKLADGRKMEIRRACLEDATDIAAAFPLPDQMLASEEAYRRYFETKALIYVRCTSTDITCAFVDGHLAGYQFYCRDLDDLRLFTFSLKNALWVFKEAAKGRYGYSPTFWLAILRWPLQHFRQPRAYGPSRDRPATECAEIAAWSRGVRTVEAYQRLGVASELMRHTEEQLVSDGIDTIALWTAVDNSPAVHLFEKLGYAKRGRVQRIGEECWLMVKDLSSEPPAQSLNAPRNGEEDSDEST